MGCVRILLTITGFKYQCDYHDAALKQNIATVSRGRDHEGRNKPSRLNGKISVWYDYSDAGLWISKVRSWVSSRFVSIVGRSPNDEVRESCMMICCLQSWPANQSRAVTTYCE
jgi:hypothetical protein